MKEFITAAERADQPETGELSFTLDGKVLRAFQPTEGQFALLMMAMGRHATQANQFAGVIDFFISVLDEPSQAYVVGRMEGRTDIIPLITIVDVMNWFIEEWGGRPTSPLSVSTPSRRNGGRRSTAPTRASTSLASSLTGS